MQWMTPARTDIADSVAPLSAFQPATWKVDWQTHDYKNLLANESRLSQMSAPTGGMSVLKY
jgi:hypothetical protein